MGEVEKVASLLGFLTPSIPGMRKQNRPLGRRPGRCQTFFFLFFLQHIWKLMGKRFFSARRKEFA